MGIRLRVVTLEGDVQAGDLTKLIEGVFPSPHPPAENLRAVSDGLDRMMSGVLSKIREDKPFSLRVENRADELKKDKSKPKSGPKPGTQRKPPAKPADKPAEPIKS